jgi:hypothetical protein
MGQLNAHPHYGANESSMLSVRRPSMRKWPAPGIIHRSTAASLLLSIRDREFAFLVGLDALIGLATLLEAAKDMLSRITRRHDGLAGWPDSSIIGNIERLRAQGLEAVCRRPK